MVAISRMPIRNTRKNNSSDLPTNGNRYGNEARIRSRLLPIVLGLVTLTFSCLMTTPVFAQPSPSSLAAKVAAENGVSAADVQVSNISLARRYTVGDTTYEEWSYSYTIKGRPGGPLVKSPSNKPFDNPFAVQQQPIPQPVEFSEESEADYLIPGNDEFNRDEDNYVLLATLGKFLVLWLVVGTILVAVALVTHGCARSSKRSWQLFASMLLCNLFLLTLIAVVALSLFVPLGLLSIIGGSSPTLGDVSMLIASMAALLTSLVVCFLIFIIGRQSLLTKQLNDHSNANPITYYLLSFRGQISRGEFWGCGYGLIVLLYVFANVMMLASIFDFSDSFLWSLGMRHGDVVLLGAALAITSYIAFAWSLLSLYWKRLRDVGLDGGRSILTLLPVVNIVGFFLATIPACFYGGMHRTDLRA